MSAHDERWDLLPPELALDEEPFDVAVLGEDELPEQVRAWTITDDDSADWAMRRLAQYEREMAELEERATAWAAKIETWFEQASRRPWSSADFFRAHLQAYALRRRFETDGRVKTVTLPSGRIATRPGSGPKVRVGDPEAFKAWALENPDHPAVRIKAELVARGAQMWFVVTDGTVVDETTGERAEWAEIEPPSPPSATVTPT